MHNEKSYFGTQNGSLAICHVGVMTIKQLSLRSRPCNRAAPLSTCTVEEQWSVIRFLWSEGVKPSEIYRRMKVQYGAIGLSLVWTYERTFAGPEVCRWRWGNGGGSKLVKGHAKKLFSRGHPQAFGLVDQVCCEAGGLCRKIRHKQFL